MLFKTMLAKSYNSLFPALNCVFLNIVVFNHKFHTPISRGLSVSLKMCSNTEAHSLVCVLLPLMLAQLAVPHFSQTHSHIVEEALCNKNGPEEKGHQRGRSLLTDFMAAAISSYLSACSASLAFCTSCSRSTILDVCVAVLCVSELKQKS